MSTNFTQELFNTIVETGGDSIAQYARTLGKSYKKVYLAVSRLEERGLVATRASRVGEHDFVQVEAVVSKEDAEGSFRKAAKPVFVTIAGQRYFIHPQAARALQAELSEALK